MKIDNSKKVLFGLSGALLGVVLFLYFGPKTASVKQAETGEILVNKVLNTEEEDDDIHYNNNDDENNSISKYILEDFTNKRSYYRYKHEDIRLIGRNEPIRYASIISDDNDDNDEDNDNKSNKPFNGADYNNGLYDTTPKKPFNGADYNNGLYDTTPKKPFNGADYNNGLYDNKIKGSDVGINDLNEVGPIKNNTEDNSKNKLDNENQKTEDNKIDKDVVNVNSFDLETKKEEKVNAGRVDSAFRQSNFYPVDKSKYQIGDKFGFINRNNTQVFHEGVDFIGDNIEGAEVYAASKGIIKTVKVNEGKDFYGNVITIEHDGFQTLYASLEGFARDIKPGTLVNEGDLIGYVGKTGNQKTEPRLHFEIIQNNKKIDPYYLLINTIKKNKTDEVGNQSNISVELNELKK